MLLLSFPQTFSLLAALPSKLCRQTEGSNEWVDVLQLNSLRPATDWHAHTHTNTHTPHIIPTVFSILSPVPLLHPDSQIHSSLFHPSIALGVWGGAVAVIGEVSSHRHSVNFLSEGLVVTMQDKGKGEKRLLVFCHSYTTSQPFCALWCASHASFYNLCVCVVHPFFQVQTDPKFVCVCVCVCVFTWVCHVVFCICMLCLRALCVCVCAVIAAPGPHASEGLSLPVAPEQTY